MKTPNLWKEFEEAKNKVFNEVYGKNSPFESKQRKIINDEVVHRFYYLVAVETYTRSVGRFRILKVIIFLLMFYLALLLMCF